ncbi:hypothetical protein FKV24_004960 [Lysobacter maris]|uniref:Uncharacterized protein n=1 Tax=Marilutibacter maris TaxID=1605891 RepID=A0A508AVT2_9GAMM|nr:hypothetical protein [Lysobacter maris]KAB8195622.1 hypothetical protein FKV24_004960 [Lysobacter maris]
MKPDDFVDALDTPDTRRAASDAAARRMAETRESLPRAIIRYCAFILTGLLALDALGLFGLGRLAAFGAAALLALLMLCIGLTISRAPRSPGMALCMTLVPLAFLVFVFANGRVFDAPILVSAGLLGCLVWLAWIRHRAPAA